MYQHILIPTDGSDLAGRGVATGLGLARALGAAATLVTVSEPWRDATAQDPSALALSCELRDEYRKAAQAQADALFEQARAQAAGAGVALETVYVVERPPAAAILETAQACGADLIVMASHGRGGFRKLLLGSQTQAVVSRGSLPVLVVR